MKKTITLFIAGSAIVLGSYLGYVIATNQELRERLIREAKDTIDISKQKINTVSEDVAITTAQLTSNPQINQEWVEKQWEAAGL